MEDIEVQFIWETYKNNNNNSILLLLLLYKMIFQHYMEY